ncbi:twin-arginine translocation signal domain-containing protein [Campylobacter sp. MIT 21-1685]|nr:MULTISPECIES: twin-arginine translocation signal domain-containing protein [unclassified Campylobacter]MCX2683402.1 twin-arginine translocation signal domain-containing protein [Campylobacter sp. MIT 21-1684]MCX2751671.1 twin-arginine translocation signal domain-containing protein [Campylobacter sp. MIT 21-1682]MCX2807872.1 twin-arginine translocation signal domain-containing protein [Campylobacter sp. MIT 21-1685]
MTNRRQFLKTSAQLAGVAALGAYQKLIEGVKFV